MVWYRYLYVDESIIQKKEKIIWKVCHNVGQIDMYLITLSHGESNLLEIISTLELMQKAYPKERLFIIGIAKGYEQACWLAWRILLDVYEQTGAFRAKTYLLAKHRGENGQVSVCP